MWYEMPFGCRRILQRKPLEWSVRTAGTCRDSSQILLGLEQSAQLASRQCPVLHIKIKLKLRKVDSMSGLRTADSRFNKIIEV